MGLYFSIYSDVLLISDVDASFKEQIERSNKHKHRNS